MMINGLHIELTNICTLQCPGCARTQFIEQWPQHWRNHSINANSLFKFLDIDINGMQILLCGNYGDPIYHPEFIELVQEFKNRKAQLSISTNGSYKKSDWWKTVAAMLDHNDTVTFSVDGTPDNFTQYRVNGDWETIKQAMQVCANANCYTQWKYIPFSYNQHSIDLAESLSQELGIDEFTVSLSDRFDEKTDYLRPNEESLGRRFHSQQQWKTVGTIAVNAKCSNNQEHFITADGYYSPCCFLADHRFYYKTQFGKHKNQYSINDHTLTGILRQPKIIEFFQTLPQNAGCQYNCPA